ncbi:MAG TPA: 16S rRNA (cytosine(967)-C(5))-methyltransferase RsmB [Nitrospirota bacterium]
MTRADRPRERALRILCSCEKGAFADDLLAESRGRFDQRDNAFILELVYGILRNRAQLDWVLNRFSRQPLSETDEWTRNILRLGAYQLLRLDKVPPSAAVNTSTELSKQFGKKSGYVNGLLRNLERNKHSLPDPDAEDAATRLSILYSHPAWLVRRWLQRFGREKTEEVLRENNHPALLVIRTNTLATSRQDLRALLESEGAVVRESAYAPEGLELISSPGIQSLTGYRKGAFIVQDEAAQLISLMLAPRPGETVLDACAAPGGKATHLAELMKDQGTLVALERSERRLDRVRENSERLGTAVIRPVVGDATTYREGAYDKVLIDAPCSGLGVLRRHPDGRWTKSETILQEKQSLQKKILDNCAALLKPGGVLVYATCATEPEENEDVVAAFLDQRGGEFMIDDPRPYLPENARTLVDEKGFFRSCPGAPQMDGFFGARLARKT